MPAPWNDWYHCMGHTYGTWLPGDPRGFRTRHHRQHVDGDYKNPPPKGKYDALHRHAKSLMTRDPVYLDEAQRTAAVRFLVESLQRRKIEVIVAAVTRIHKHVVARFPDRNPRHWLGVAKKESSHHCKQASLAPPGGLWAVRTKNVPISDRAHQLRAARYVFDHKDEGGAVWYRGRVTPPRP